MTLPEPTSTQTSQLVRWACALVIAASAAGTLADLFNVEPPMQSANDRSRWCTVWSLVHKQTYTIDEIIRKSGWDSIDKVRHNGHFYSSKPPLLATVMAGFYWVLHKYLGFDLVKHQRETISVLLILMNWLPWLVAQAVFARSVMRHASTDFARFLLVTALALGTMLTPFQVTFNNHTVAAVSLILAVAPILPVLSGERLSMWRFVVCGFMSGFAVSNEMPAFVFGILVFLVLLRFSVGKTLLGFGPAALLPLGAFFLTNHICTGGFKPFQSQYGTEIYRYIHEGVPSYWMNPGGIDASTEPWPVYLLHCLVGHHGWLSLTPLFLLVFPGWWIGLRQPGRARIVAAVTALLTVWVFAFYASRTENYNYGGNTSGLRWTFWLIPFWLWSLIPVLDAWAGGRIFRLMTVGLLAVSAFSAAMPRDNPWRPPWLQVLMQDWGWVDYRDKKEAFPPSRRIWIDPVPTRDGAGIDLAGMTRSGPLRVTLTTPRGNGEGVREIEYTRDEVDVTSTVRLLVNLDAVRKGRAAEECLRHSAWGQSPWEDLTGQSREMVQFLRGMPEISTASYAVKALRYIKVPARKDAFRCRQAVIAVDYGPGGKGAFHRFRRDVWLSDEVPFGVVQVEDTVTNPADGTVLYKERLQLVRIR